MNTDQDIPQNPDHDHRARAGEAEVLPPLRKRDADRRRLSAVTVTKFDVGSIALRLSQSIEDNAPIERLVKRLAFIAENATTTSRGKGGGAVDDYRTQLEAIRTLLAYHAGKPVERQIHENAEPDDEDDEELMKRVLGSPALRRAIERKISTGAG